MPLTNHQDATTQPETSMEYPVPQGSHLIPEELLDLRTDAEIDADLQQPQPVTDEKNIWFFWHQGFMQAHPYAQRTVRAWYRRFSKYGWRIYVIDRLPGSPLNVENFLDVRDPSVFPTCFINGEIGGNFAPQHTSDLVRFPLLLKYGGAYSDITFMQIGDFDKLWNNTIANSNSPYEVLSYNAGDVNERSLCNYFLCSRRDNPYFQRCHKLFLSLWNADGGKADTEGMHKSPLLKGLSLQGENGGLGFEENGCYISDREAAEILTDYLAQVQCAKMVMGLIDEEDGWNGPEYCVKHVYAIDYMEGSQLINEFTAWRGPEAFRLMSLSLPREGEVESEDQKKAREIVEACLSRSFGFKLAHGLIIRFMGETLGSLWRKNVGSDNVRGTYAHWLRQGMIYCSVDNVPPRQDWQEIPPYKVGPLLQETDC